MPRPFAFSASLHTLLLLLRTRLPVFSGWGTSHLPSAQPSSPPVCFSPLTTAIIGAIYSDSHIIRTSLGTERSGTPSRCAPRPDSSWSCFCLVHTQAAAGLGPRDWLVHRAAGWPWFGMVQDGRASAPCLGFQHKLLD